MTAAEAALETMIDSARCWMLRAIDAGDLDTARAALRDFERLIGQRSAAQVRRMEQARGC